MKRMGMKPTDPAAVSISTAGPQVHLIRGGSLLRSRGAARAGWALAERARSEFHDAGRSRSGASMRRQPPNSALQLTRAAGPSGETRGRSQRPAQLNAQR